METRLNSAPATENPVSRVWEAIRSLVPRSSTVVVAVSGGVDSVVLLDALSATAGELGLKLLAAHLNHKLRRESDGEAFFVRELAGELRISFVTEEAPPRPPRENLEAWARGVRYDFLERVRKAKSADYIATAHHQNDLVETLLFRIVTGRLATAGSAMSTRDEERKLLRPFLALPRAVLEAYAGERALRFVEDTSNRDLERTRNRIRHDLLPKLAGEYNPNILRSLSELSERLHQDEGQLWIAADEAAQRWSKHSTTVAELENFSPALQWRMLKILAAWALGERAEKLGYRRLSQLVEQVGELSSSGGELDVGFGVVCRLERGVLSFCESHAERRSRSVVKAEPLPVPGELSWPLGDGSSCSISARVIGASAVEADCGSWADDAVAFFDAGVLARSGLIVRQRHFGDAVSVYNRGRRTLKKLLQEHGVNLTLRNTLPIVECNDEIMWVPGVARSGVAPVGPASSSILALHYRRVPQGRR